jgi:hypothetical protein
MYDLEKELVNKSRIIRYEVWFMVPFKGLFETCAEACSACKDIDLLPELAISPTPVAITEDGSYEIIAR